MILQLQSDEEIAKTLVERIKKERIAQQLSQEDLADRADIGISIVRNFEQNSKITLVHMISILKALGKTHLFLDLFDFEKERIEIDAFEYRENRTKIYDKKRVRK